MSFRMTANDVEEARVPPGGSHSEISQRVKLEPTESSQAQCNPANDDDDVTVIMLDPAEQRSYLGILSRSHYNRNRSAVEAGRNAAVLAWIENSDSPAMEERRRSILLAELKRSQRTSFYHCLLMCTVPTILLLIIMVTVAVDSSKSAASCQDIMPTREASAYPNGSVVDNEWGHVRPMIRCRLEARNFLSGRATRCVCDAIPSLDVVTKRELSEQP
jgi:hypothetical protein